MGSKWNPAPQRRNLRQLCVAASVHGEFDLHLFRALKFSRPITGQQYVDVFPLTNIQNVGDEDTKFPSRFSWTTLPWGTLKRNEVWRRCGGDSEVVRRWFGGGLERGVEVVRRWFGAR